MEQFLTDKELERLTGYRQHSKQVAYCRSQGIPFSINAKGVPVVSRDAFLQKGPTRKSAQRIEQTDWRPDVLQR